VWEPAAGASESQRREWSRAERKGEEDLERGESQEEEEWTGGEDRGSVG